MLRDMRELKLHKIFQFSMDSETYDGLFDKAVDLIEKVELIFACKNIKDYFCNMLNK